MNRYIPGILTKCEDGSKREIGIGYTLIEEAGVLKFDLPINNEWLSDIGEISFNSCHLGKALHDYNEGN